MPKSRRSSLLWITTAAVACAAMVPALVANTRAFEERRRELSRQWAEAQRAEGLAGSANRKALYAKYPTPEIGLVKAASLAPGQSASIKVPGQFVEGTVFLVESDAATVSGETQDARSFSATIAAPADALPGFVRVWAFSPVSGAWNRVSVAFVGQPREHRFAASNGWTVVLSPEAKAFDVTQNEAKAPYRVEFFKPGEPKAFETLGMMMQLDADRQPTTVSASLNRGSSGAMAEYEKLGREMSDPQKFMKMSDKQRDAFMKKMEKLMEQVQAEMMASMATQETWQKEFGCHYINVPLAPGGTGNVSCGEAVGNLTLTPARQ
ncbi:MAG: hypothetical protein KJ061_14490 [Vicinamibacteraceae bacterium]|nr:hypothetical protein [Vicinamibacteraceae bacterium]